MTDAPDTAALRPPEVVMRLSRMGAMFPTRLSFLRAMLRRARHERWRIERAQWSLDANGFGHAVYTVRMPERSYSLVAFSQDLPPERRTDRVIAQEWDTSYVLYDGIPDAAEIARLRANVPRQEAGRFTARDLILSRANKSVRLYDVVVRALASGKQPDTALVEDVGYLLRTTAVYGNGKFGIADRELFAERAEFAAPFQAEMLTVWLIRSFSLDLVEHCARCMAPDTALPLTAGLRRRFGMGNATGLGMAPFLVRHPLLLHHWMMARETALARVRALPSATAATWSALRRHLAAARMTVAHWQTQDPVQAPRLAVLQSELGALSGRFEEMQPDDARPWDTLYRWAEANVGVECQEYLVALLVEPHGELIDDLCDMLSADERATVPIDGAMGCGALRGLIATHYGWALGIDHAAQSAQARFWYASAEKLEPRLGDRFDEAGAELEQPLTFARDVAALDGILATHPAATVAAFLRDGPEWRHVVRRVQIAARYRYAEIRDNLIGAELRPIDLLRCKLAMFGATRFDPRSDRWVRITLFQGAPFPEEMARGETEDALGLAA